MPRAPWVRVAFGLIGVSVLVSLVPATGGRAGTVLYLVPVLLAITTLVVAVRAIPPAQRAPWTWLALAQVMFGVGEILFAVLSWRGDEGYPTLADAIYLAAFIPMAIGLLGLNRQRLNASYRGDLLDAAIVTVSAAVLFGVFFVMPVAADTSMGMSARLVSSVYPVADILMIFLLARMLTGPGARTTAYWCLVIAAAATIGADTGWNIVQLTIGSDSSPRWMNALWQSYYIFNAAAACGATASRLSEKKPRTDGGLDVLRLTVLALAAVLPAAVVIGLSLAHRPTHAAWLAAGSIIVVALVVARIWDLLQQVRSQAVQLAALARTDPLTGIANRRTWDHEISRACAQARQDGGLLYVALLDMDHFKQYNDTNGHSAGDDLLQQASQAWAQALPPPGLLARWGGEEFAVALPTTSPDAALAQLDGLRALVPDKETCSIGVARWDGTETPAALLRRADQALYDAKSGGRNRLVLRDDPRPSANPAIPEPRSAAGSAGSAPPDQPAVPPSTVHG
jgi:diguanylate cyclase (GGDEF)-like protein